MPDKTLKCVDCGTDFVFSEKEQAYFAEKQLTEPKRCKPCRDIRRQAKAREGPPPRR